MPPFLPRKRLSSTPPQSSRPTPTKKARLADVLDAEIGNLPSAGRAKVFSVDSDSSDSSLSDVDSEVFEDVSTSFRNPTANLATAEDDEEEDEDIEWEDAGGKNQEETPEHVPLAGGDIQLTFRTDEDGPSWVDTSTTNTGKKGPTKREKQVRILTHKLHVQFLLGHNAIRNSWINDKIVQETLMQQLPPQIEKEIEKWRRMSGLTVKEPEQENKKRLGKGKKGGKQKRSNKPDGRDWATHSHTVQSGRADLSHGDPLIILLKILSAYWKKRFAITAPGLRKRGYSTKQALKQEIASLKNDEHNPEKHGERIRNIKEFRELAKKCEGSRDVGAQLFTALLRAIGIESRLVASLQPTGFGWTKAEQILPRKVAKAIQEEDSSDESDSEEGLPAPMVAPLKTSSRGKGGAKKATKNNSKRSIGNKTAPINLDTDAELDEKSDEIKDDDSVVDITPSLPKSRVPKYDRDVPFPIYWTEAISPITNKVIPVSPLVLATPVTSTAELVYQFEPRGAKAEKAKIVMAYVVAFSPDRTAKEVTTRYLKKRVWPGKTKGFRYPAEKIAIYDKHGRIKRHENYDWFKHVMISFLRPEVLRTTADDLEDSSDLVPQQPEKKVSKDEVDTLTSLKSSADFVLERHLRREEAIRPGAQPDRMFMFGKGDNMKEEPVYRRSDVERCLTAESWHKEGRRPKEAEVPMKMVPVRAVTLTRKREADEHERMTGEKQMQGLYSWDQTEYIIPPPIENGIIPKNSYGNMDCFVPSMVPKGAVHIPLRGTVRICKKLEIDYAEAVTGFEFGNKRAVPVCTGVVVAKENKQAVIDAWHVYNEEQRKKEETKMEKLVLDLWRKFVMGLRIRERVEETYGDAQADEAMDNFRGQTREDPINLDDEHNPPSNSNGPHADIDDDEDMAGGFLLPHEDEETRERHHLDVIMDHHDEEPEPKQKMRAVPEPDSDDDGNGSELSSAPESLSTARDEDGDDKDEYQGPSSATRSGRTRAVRSTRVVRSRYFEGDSEGNDAEDIDDDDDNDDD